MPEKCTNCNLPLATSDDAVEALKHHPTGGCECDQCMSVCWATYNGACRNERSEAEQGEWRTFDRWPSDGYYWVIGPSWKQVAVVMVYEGRAHMGNGYSTRAKMAVECGWRYWSTPLVPPPLPEATDDP